MTKVHQGLEDPGFVPPEGVSKISICASTGMRNTTYCSSVKWEWYINDTMPGYCTTHGGAIVSRGEYPEGY